MAVLTTWSSGVAAEGGAARVPVDDLVKPPADTVAREFDLTASDTSVDHREIVGDVREGFDSQFDPEGDVDEPRADIVSSYVDASQAGLYMSTEVAQYANPFTDPNWTGADKITSARWYFDVDLDGEWEFEVVLWTIGGELVAFVYDTADQVVCGPTEGGADSAIASYWVSIDPDCIANPAGFYWYSAMVYDSGADPVPFDIAPDGTDWAGPVVNDAAVFAGAPIVSVTPSRLLETRPGETTSDGQFQGIGRRAAGSTTELVVTGRGGVVASASAVMLNVTAVFPSGPGFLTVYPCGESQPLSSSVNYRGGDVRPNAVLAKIGTGGRICIFTSADSDLIVDVNGYVPSGGSPISVVPARILETRPGLETVDGAFQGIGRIPAGEELWLDVSGRAGVDLFAAAVMMNVTAVFPSGPGFLTVYPCGEQQPVSSSVNYFGGDVVPNAVLAKLGVRGFVCIVSSAETDIIVDVNGYVPAGGGPNTVVPARLLETRVGVPTVDGQFQGLGRRAAGSETIFFVTKRAGVATSAESVMLNVTAVFPSNPGFLTVYPCGISRPQTSSVNYFGGDVVPNAVLAKVGSGGRVCVYTSAETDLIVDVSGFVPI